MRKYKEHILSGRITPVQYAYLIRQGYCEKDTVDILIEQFGGKEI